MSWIATAVVGSAVVGGVASSRASGKAVDAQLEASDAAIGEQRAAREELRELLSPFTQAGTGAVPELTALGGAGTPEAEAAAIDRIRGGPEFEALVGEAEEGILASGSATGNLRGGNIREALASTRPSILSNLINQRFSRLMGITQIGQSSAAGQGTAGLQSSRDIGNIMLNQGEAIGQGALAQGQAFGNVAGSIGTIGLLSDPTKGFGKF